MSDAIRGQWWTGGRPWPGADTAAGFPAQHEQRAEMRVHPIRDREEGAALI